MRSVLSSYVLVLLLAASGCCRTYYPSLPTRPIQVDGWKHSTKDTVLTICSLLLNKGESAENDKLGITFLDLEPATLCSGPLSEPSSAKLRLRFFNPSDRRRLCETTILIPNGAISGGGNLDCSHDELPPSFSIRAYNAKEGWIWLELTTTVGETRW